MAQKKKSKRYLYAHPKTGKKVSRQRIWQLKQQRSGGCMKCGKPTKNFRCKRCQKEHLKLQKKAA